jgi:hypothetical protein
MKLKTLLFLQLAYLVLGTGYNVVSYAMVASGRAPLAPTPPILGAASMAIYGLCLLPGVFRYVTVYRVLMAIAVFVLGYGGVVKHILNFPAGLSVYASPAAWVAAVAINIYGAVLNVAAAAGRFHREG